MKNQSLVCHVQGFEYHIWSILGYFSSNPMFSLFLQLPGKKVLDPNGPYIHTFLRNVCLSVILKFCLSSYVICSASTAYTSLCRSLKHLLKVKYIILNYLKMARFLIFETLCLGRAKTWTYVWKNLTKMSGIWVWYHIASPNFHRICV